MLSHISWLILRFSSSNESIQFPFYQGEVYHQYHNDFQSPPYGKDYNLLANLALEEGRIKGTGCPDRI